MLSSPNRSDAAVCTTLPPKALESRRGSGRPVFRRLEAGTKGDAMAGWWQRCGTGRHVSRGRRRPGRATAFFVVVMVMTGPVACSAGQEDQRGTTSSDGSTNTAPTSPSDEPSHIKTPPSASAKSAGVECLGRSVTIVGTAGPDRLVGVPSKRDVFLTLGGDDLVTNVGGRDRVCAGGGDDRVATPKGGHGPEGGPWRW